MFRLIVVGLIGYIVYKTVKSYMLKSGQMKTVRGLDPDQIDDVMVKDPYCGVYLPKKDGVRFKDKGKELFFCSEKCRVNFLREKTKK